MADILSTAKDAFASGGSPLAAVGPQLLNGLWNGIKSGISFLDNNPINQQSQSVGNQVFGAPTTPNGNIQNPIGQSMLTGPDLAKAQSASTSPKITPQVKSTSVSAPAAQPVTTPVSAPITQSYDTQLGNQGYTAAPGDQPYKVDTSNSTSQSLSGGMTANDVLTRRQQMENLYMQQYQQSVQAQQDLSTAKLQDMGMVQDALYSGHNESYGQGAAGLAQNAANIREAMLGIKAQTPLLLAQGASNMLGFQNQDIQNQLATVPNLQNVQQAADGSIIGFVRDPLTGKVTSQNFGNPLLGTFSGDGQTGANIGGGASSQSLSSNAGAITLPANGDGTYQTPSGGSVNQYYAQQISGMSPQYQKYVLPGPQGTAYIDGSRLSQLPGQIQMQIQSQAANAGIPWLDQTAAAGIQSVYSLYDTLDLMNNLVDQTLSSGPAGHLKDWAASKINDIFQNNPKLQNFNNLRTLAGQADTNLMGGIGSGFRQNSTNLGLSVQNLPVATDSLETAKTKIAATRALLDQSMLKTFPGFQGTGSLTSNGSTPAASTTYVQTKVGAIPTNW